MTSRREGDFIATLIWMALLTAVMVFEKTQPAGRQTAPFLGAAFLALAAIVALLSSQGLTHL